MKRTTVTKSDIYTAIRQDLPMKTIRGASKDYIERFCRKEWGCSFKEACIAYKCRKIRELIQKEIRPTDIFHEVFGAPSDDLGRCYRYVERYMQSFLHLKNVIGGQKMSKHAELVLETLTGRKNRLTAYNIAMITKLTEAEVRSAIIELRELKFPVISVPGRTNSGYRLHDPARTLSQEWINHIRENRYGLVGDFSY